MTTMVLTVEDEFTPLDLLLWRHFRREILGLVEQTLAGNRGLAALGPILPVGTKVTVQAPVPITQQVPRTIIRLVD